MLAFQLSAEVKEAKATPVREAGNHQPTGGMTGGIPQR